MLTSFMIATTLVLAGTAYSYYQYKKEEQRRKNQDNDILPDMYRLQVEAFENLERRAKARRERLDKERREGPYKERRERRAKARRERLQQRNVSRSVLSDLREFLSDNSTLSFSTLMRLKRETKPLEIPTACKAFISKTQNIPFGKVTLNGDWSNAVFVGAQLNSSHLGGSFDNTDFTNANLENIEISAEKIEGVSFVGAVLKRADCSKTHFIGCDFSGADLSMAILTDVVFEDCQFSKAIIRHSDVSSTRFKNSDLKNATITERLLQLVVCVKETPQAQSAPSLRIK